MWLESPQKRFSPVEVFQARPPVLQRVPASAKLQQYFPRHRVPSFRTRIRRPPTQHLQQYSEPRFWWKKGGNEHLSGTHGASEPEPEKTKLRGYYPRLLLSDQLTCVGCIPELPPAPWLPSDPSSHPWLLWNGGVGTQTCERRGDTATEV